MPTPTDDDAPPPGQTRLPNGITLAWDRAGQGAPLVFLHGVMGDWRSWDPQWAAFTARHDCLRYSRRYNHPNRNTGVDPDHSARVEADDLRGLLDALGWTRAILVGSSYGAFTALAFAVAQPQRCLALALSEPPMMRYAMRSAAGRAAEAAFRRDTIEPANAAFRRGDDEAGARIMTGGINGSTTAPMSAAALRRRLQNIQAMKNLALSRDEFPWLAPEDLGALPMPVLLLAGEHTPPIHAEIFRNVCAAMPQAEVVRVPGAGHGTSRDNPEAFNRMVLDFLNRHVTYPTA